MLTSVLTNVKWMEPSEHEGLTMVGLSCDGGRGLDPTSLDFALRRGQLRIEETREGAQVPFVDASNQGPRPVLLLAGEEIIGALQNRILNTSSWLDAQQQARVAVSCVEQGRWARQRAGDGGFQSASTMYFPSGMRGHTRRVNDGYRTTRAAHGDQHQVWSDVQTRLRHAGASATTHAMHELYDAADGGRLDRFATTLRCRPRQNGFAALAGGRLVALEIFCSRAFCASVYGKYLRAYALDGGLGGRRARGGFRLGDLDELLRLVRAIPVEQFPSTGRGEDVRFECARFHGSALLVEGALAHLSVFAN